MTVVERRSTVAGAGVHGLYTGRMVRSGALEPRPGVRRSGARPGAIARPLVLIGRGTAAHTAVVPNRSRPAYRRLRVGGPIVLRRVPQNRRRPTSRGAMPGRYLRLGASPRLMVATLAALVLLLGAASTSLA